jgi:hypothetical protein
MKKFLIKKGSHSSSGFHFGFTFKDRISFEAKFDESCLYTIDDNDKYDVNKLFGFSTTIFHHKQSARLGWRCLDGSNIQLLTYSYNDSKRDLKDLDVICEVKPDQLFFAEIIDLEDKYEYRVFLDTDDFIIKHDKKKKDWMPFHYFLFPYFGGNKTAPHDMKIFIER